jgi:cyclic pyranopterin phosphate synthase
MAITIYTDGACLGNPGPGGWAAILVEDGSERTVQGREQKTTNNRMEMLAAIKGLDASPESSHVTVISDSRYVVNTMTLNWKRKANQDLWGRLDAEVNKRTVRWQWVRGHAGVPLNEQVDKLAHKEAKMAARPTNSSLTHVDESGNARMVDVGSKRETRRVAVARGSVVMRPETLELIKANGLDKGDVIGVARVAGIGGAKSVSSLVPLCHPVPLDQVSVEFDFDDRRSAVDITATAKAKARTGVEMEALSAVSVAALTIYDMCKGVDRGMRITDVRLAKKTGGSSGDIVLEE